MLSGVAWPMLSVALLASGFATLDTTQLLQVANGVVRSGLIDAIQPAQPLTSKATAVQSETTTQAKAGRESVTQLAEFTEQVEQLWLSESQLSSQSMLVQYSADKRSRALIDLKEGKLVVEHLASVDVASKMQRVLANALLTPDDPRQVDLLLVQDFSQSEHPFLLGQLVDSLGKPIDTRAKADKFAAWAVVNKTQLIETSIGQMYRIELPLDANHKQVRAARFARYIEAAAQEFAVDVNLLYAITETESHFNPFAMSHTGALGLMQVMPDTAGRDAIKYLTGVSRQPSYQELTDPQTNIRLGAAYLSLLQDHYLKAIDHPHSREYAMIAAYNGGASRAISVFSSNKNHALTTINALPPQMVYDSIKRRHASAETRGYLEKVTTAKRRYSSRV